MLTCSEVQFNSKIDVLVMGKMEKHKDLSNIHRGQIISIARRHCRCFQSTVISTYKNVLLDMVLLGNLESCPLRGCYVDAHHLPKQWPFFFFNKIIHLVTPSSHWMLDKQH